jgi:hypothetical protein
MSLETSMGASSTLLVKTDSVRRGIGNVVQWNYSSLEQAWEWRCLFYRLSVARGRRTVGLSPDTSGGNDSAALPLSALVAVLNIGLCFIQAAFNAAGQIDSTRVLADRASGKLCDIPEGCR